MISRKYNRSDLAHFRFLGLRRGECDASAIRSAASAMSGLIGECEGHLGVEGEVQRRSEIALAAYRLLDPRRRASFYERVQLSYPIDREDQMPAVTELGESAAGTPNPWVPQAASHGCPSSDAPASATANAPKLMKLPVIDRAIQEELKEPAMAQAAAETLSWLEERREVIRSLREMEPQADRAPSPMRWIRSVLGW